MSALRPLFLTLMVLMVLPWGAYAGVGGSWAHLHGHGTAVTTAPVTPLIERARHNCRTATLPGAPCGTDLAPPPAETGLVAPDWRGAVAARSAGWHNSHPSRPPVRPPRLLLKHLPRA
jgi:hypothetical protein